MKKQITYDEISYIIAKSFADHATKEQILKIEELVKKLNEAKERNKTQNT